MKRNELLSQLRETDPARLNALWQAADATRRAHVGDDVHLRGLVEVSSHCVRRCTYCGLRAPNQQVRRYRMHGDEVLEAAHLAVQLGYGTLVLQSGEDPQLSLRWVAELVRRIKSETPLAVTLSLGERARVELETWRLAGADRYLLRFETSNAELFARIHPPRPGAVADRLTILQWLRELGYEVGSGVMIGIPGQTYDDLTSDLLLFTQIDLDMIGVGPFLPHPATPLGTAVEHFDDPEQVPNSELMTYKVLALTRLLCPTANIPSTTALATINRQTGRQLGLERGANIVMPNITPLRYRAGYEIYPGKACLCEEPGAYDTLLRAQLAALGRPVGTGRGDSAHWRHRQDAPPARDDRPDGGRSFHAQAG